jgi:hypothetical protein
MNLEKQKGASASSPRWLITAALAASHSAQMAGQWSSLLCSW